MLDRHVGNFCCVWFRTVRLDQGYDSQYDTTLKPGGCWRLGRYPVHASSGGIKPPGITPAVSVWGCAHGRSHQRAWANWWNSGDWSTCSYGYVLVSALVFGNGRRFCDIGGTQPPARLEVFTAVVTRTASRFSIEEFAAQGRTQRFCATVNSTRPRHWRRYERVKILGSSGAYSFKPRPLSARFGTRLHERKLGNCCVRRNIRVCATPQPQNTGRRRGRRCRRAAAMRALGAIQVFSIIAAPPGRSLRGASGAAVAVRRGVCQLYRPGALVATEAKQQLAEDAGYSVAG
jgi:hypothetical protein